MSAAGHYFWLIIRRVIRGLSHLITFISLLSLPFDGKFDSSQLLSQSIGFLLQRGSLVLFFSRQLGGLFGFDARSGGKLLLSFGDKSRNIANTKPSKRG